MNNILRLESSHSFEEGASITARTNGGIAIPVAEEQPVDSYNHTFECTLTATKEQAIELRDWLILLHPIAGG